MPTLEKVAASVLASIAADADRPIGIELAADWVNRRYEELVSRCRFRHQRRMGVISTPEAINDGSATATRGSSTIVADGDLITAIVAAGGASAIEGRHIRLATVWYLITDWTSPNITIDGAYGEPDVTDSGVLIVQRYYDLATDARWLGRFVHMRRRREVENRSFESLDRTVPERQLHSEGPWYWAEVGVNPTTGAKRIELYPYSNDAEIIHYVYWRLPVAHELSDDLPKEVDTYTLREGALIDAFRYRASQEANGGRVEAAAFWRNESRAQETKWELVMRRAARTDRGADDISFIYHLLGLSGSDGPADIVDARSEVWARGNRP